jgi:hypothetical protein
VYTYLLFAVQTPAIEIPIRRFLAAHATKLLPGTLSSQPALTSYGDFLLVTWHVDTVSPACRKRINPGVLTHSSKGLFFSNGYCAEAVVDCSGDRSHDDSAAVFRIVSTSNGRLSLASSLGGVGSCTYLHNSGKCAYCWSTQPPAIPTFYANNQELGITVVGNRPRLVHCASRLTNSTVLRSDYLPEYISAGFAVSGHTIYQDTHAIPPNRSLRVDCNGPHLMPYPLDPLPEIDQACPLFEKGSMLAQLLADSCWPAKAIGQSTLWLSGGKDSRAIACALSDASASVDTFTFGLADQKEAFSASIVASAAEWKHEIYPQLIISDPLRAAAHCNAATDGLGIAFAHQYDFDYDVSFVGSRPSFHGHGHLLRGGFARTMMRERRLLQAAMHNYFCSTLCSSTTSAFISGILSTWESDRSSFFKEYRELLYYSNLDFRLGLFSAPSTLDLTAKTFMVYPLLDERVARFASSLYTFDKVSERVLFAALTMLCPHLAELPLYGESWRFERFGPETKYVDGDSNFEAGFGRRRPREPCKTLAPDINGLVFDIPHLKSGKHGQLKAAYILESSIRDKLPDILVADFLRDLHSIASGGQLEGSTTRSLSTDEFLRLQMVNRVFIASTLYDLRWQ